MFAENMNQFEDALVCYDKAILIDPNYVDAWNNKAFALQSLNKPEEAQKCYTSAEEAKIKVEALKNLKRAQLRLGNDLEDKVSKILEHSGNTETSQQLSPKKSEVELDINSPEITVELENNAPITRSEKTRKKKGTKITFDEISSVVVQGKPRVVKKKISFATAEEVPIPLSCVTLSVALDISGSKAKTSISTISEIPETVEFFDLPATRKKVEFSDFPEKPKKVKKVEFSGAEKPKKVGFTDFTETTKKVDFSEKQSKVEFSDFEEISLEMTKAILQKNQHTIIT